MPVDEFQRLSAPPRTVPWSLQCLLLTNRTTLLGSILFLVGGSFAPIFVRAADPMGTWLLARERSQTTGWIEHIEKTSYSVRRGSRRHGQGTPVFRYDYTFRLPDESVVRGSSYSVGQRYTMTVDAAGDPARQPQVTIEYNPSRPQINRITGMRTSPFGMSVLLVALLPVAGLAVVIVGLSSARSQVWLLRHGQLTKATIINCKLTNASGGRAASVPDLKRVWKSSAVARSIPPWFVKLYSRGTIAMFLFGVVFCIGMIVGGLTGKVDVGSTSKLSFVAMFSGFLVIWVAVMSFLLSGARKLRAVAAGTSSLEDFRARAQCTIEYELPGRKKVRIKQTVTITPRLGTEATEPVLYDPAEPRRALLLNGLGLPTTVNLHGRLASEKPLGSILRLCLVGMSLIGPVAIWSFLR